MSDNDVREKIVELIEQSGACFDCFPVGDYEQKQIEKIVNHIIANGVTVQEWISVDDELPGIPEGCTESPEPVLYMMKNTKTIYAGYYGEGGVWRDKYFRQYADSRNGVDADDVLCWIYQHDLPKPPKGE